MRRLIGRLACWLKRWVEFNDQMWQLIRDDRTVAEQLKGIAVCLAPGRVKRWWNQ